MIEIQPIYFYIFTFIFSLCIGSFLNVVIARLPKMLFREWRNECRVVLELPEQEEDRVNLIHPRSQCPKCNQLIPAWHNIPLLSFFILRGKCANCQQKISWRYPLVELMSGLLAVLCAYHFGQTPNFIFSLLFCYIGIAIFFIDLDHQIIPDGLSLSLVWLGLLANTLGLFTDLSTAVYSAVIAYLVLWLFIQIFYAITGKVGMGNGDFKLFAAFGAWMGWQVLPLILLLSSFVGAIIGIIYLKFSKQGKDTPIPFGPFLMISGFIALLYGPAIIQWYIGFY